MAIARKGRKPVELQLKQVEQDAPLLGGPKLPFDVHRVLELIEAAVKGYRKAALFELADDGFGSPFEVLVACIISVRTLDEVTVPTAKALFEVARTPAKMGELTPAQIDKLIHSCTFHGAKSRDIHELSKRIVAQYGGELPCDFDVLTSFRGVGPKCANLTLGVACASGPKGKAQLGIGVDIHRTPCDQPLGLRACRDAGEDHGTAAPSPAAGSLGVDQPAAGAVRQARVHGVAAALLVVPGEGVLQPGGRGRPAIVRIGGEGRKAPAV